MRAAHMSTTLGPPSNYACTFPPPRWQVSASSDLCAMNSNFAQDLLCSEHTGTSLSSPSPVPVCAHRAHCHSVMPRFRYVHDLEFVSYIKKPMTAL